MKLLTRSIIVLTAALTAAAAGVWIDMSRFANRPAGAGDAAAVIVVAPGQGFSQVAAELEEKDIIASRWRFKLLARVRGDDKRLKTGEYKLSADMTPTGILETLVSGKVLLHRLVVPEGHTIQQIAAEIARIELTDADEFKTLTADTDLVTDLGLEGASFEGYLFPDTYYFPRGVAARTIIETMVTRFREQVPASWRDRAGQIGLTMHQVVTLASIVEKETGDPVERPMIASVFHNRLKKKMRLESDPTVIYGIEDFDGNITRRHLNTVTPFNTYRIRGLPPGPIANPGKMAIEAVLFPAQTDYLFFVSKQDGTHYFSTTLSEHNKAVRKYQLRKR